jgi:hypothetical protein
MSESYVSEISDRRGAEPVPRRAHESAEVPTR